MHSFQAHILQIPHGRHTELDVEPLLQATYPHTGDLGEFRQRPRPFGGVLNGVDGPPDQPPADGSLLMPHLVREPCVWARSRELMTSRSNCWRSFPRGAGGAGVARSCISRPSTATSFALRAWRGRIGRWPHHRLRQPVDHCSQLALERVLPDLQAQDFGIGHVVRDRQRFVGRGHRGDAGTGHDLAGADVGRIDDP